jgi:hypothetical protein
MKNLLILLTLLTFAINVQADDSMNIEGSTLETLEYWVMATK